MHDLPGGGGEKGEEGRTWVRKTSSPATEGKRDSSTEFPDQDSIEQVAVVCTIGITLPLAHRLAAATHRYRPGPLARALL